MPRLPALPAGENRVRPWSHGVLGALFSCGRSAENSRGGISQAARCMASSATYSAAVVVGIWRRPRHRQNTDCRGHAWSRDREMAHVLARSPARPGVDVVRSAGGLDGLHPHASAAAVSLPIGRSHAAAVSACTGAACHEDSPRYMYSHTHIHPHTCTRCVVLCRTRQNHHHQSVPRQFLPRRQTAVRSKRLSTRHPTLHHRVGLGLDTAYLLHTSYNYACKKGKKRKKGQNQIFFINAVHDTSLPNAHCPIVSRLQSTNLSAFPQGKKPIHGYIAEEKEEARRSDKRHPPLPKSQCPLLHHLLEALHPVSHLKPIPVLKPHPALPALSHLANVLLRVL